MVTAALVTILLVIRAPAAASERWYRPEHAHAGADVYVAHCATCHGADGAGAPRWQQRDPEGYFPPPPLNGTGHSWHHPLRELYAMIHDGSPRGAGRMPGWGGQLSRGEILAVIAHFQSWWPDEIYRAWQRMDRASDETATPAR